MNVQPSEDSALSITEKLGRRLLSKDPVVRADAYNWGLANIEQLNFLEYEKLFFRHFPSGRDEDYRNHASLNVANAL